MSLISRRASYGLRTMYRLAERAEENTSTTIAWLAENEHLPRKYLEQILRDLKQAKLVDSRSGPNGGCRLARPAEEITVGDVVRALDGSISLSHCLEEGHIQEHADCPGCWGVASCSMREVWMKLQGAIDDVLDSVTIADLMVRQRDFLSQRAVNYQI